MVQKDMNRVEIYFPRFYRTNFSSDENISCLFVLFLRRDYLVLRMFVFDKLLFGAIRRRGSGVPSSFHLSLIHISINILLIHISICILFRSLFQVKADLVYTRSFLFPLLRRNDALLLCLLNFFIL